MRSLAFAVVLCLLAAAPAGATISPAETLDGPSADVLDIGGVAMAQDGTGGLVYRKRVDGRPHIFAAQFLDGRWRTPQRVDDQPFDASWPAIGAADGGRLVVSWVQEFGASDRMYAATLAPGSRRFGRAVPVDLDVGEPEAVHPTMAIARGGTGYLTYWVTERDPTLPPGLVAGELRVARYSGELWSGFGVPLNRNASAPVRQATPATAPRVTIDATGAGILAWVEPDDEQIDRVWARRLFGSSYGFLLPVSPQRWGDRPLRGPADAFSLDQSGFGQGAIVFRQQPGTQSALPGPVVMASTIGETFTDVAREFSAPTVIAEGEPQGVAAAVAPGGGLLATLGVDDASLAVTVEDGAVAPATRLDPGTSTGAPSPVADLAESGAAAFAWRQSIAGRGSVALRERRADGTEAQRAVFAQRGGVVGALRLAGSGAGDAVAGWVQGTGQFAQVAGAVVNAPPGEFTVATPADFVRPERLRLRWDTPVNAIGRLRYTVTVADETLAENLRGTRLDLEPDDIEDGVLIAQVIAVDDAGQETSSAPSELRVDGTAPTATVARLRGRRVRVRVTDDPEDVDGGGSGVVAESVRVRIGAAKPVRGLAEVTRRIARPGPLRVVVTATDVVGNRRTQTLRVRVR